MLDRSEFRGAFLTLGALVVFVLLIVSFSPGLPGELLLQTLRFHIVAVGLVCAVFAVAFGARWRGGLGALLCIAAAAHGAYLIYELHQRRADPPGPTLAEFTVLSYNVLTGNRTPEAVVEYIVASGADVVVVMETPGIERQLDQLAEAYPYRVGCDRTATCDLSIHSRHPIAQGEVRKLYPYFFERLGVAEVTIDGHAITFVGAHLTKPYFDNASWIESVEIVRALQNIEGPVVLAGDFNAAPWSEPMAYLTERGGLAPPPGHPATWPVVAGPLGVPIDNMYTRGEVRIESIEAGRETHGSNHRPLLARIGVYAFP